MKRSPSLFTSVLLVLSLVAASIAVPATADAQTINVNVDFSSGSSSIMLNALGTADEVSSITVKAHRILNSDLIQSTELENTLGIWDGTLSELPYDEAILFTASAFNDSSVIIFSGVLTRTLVDGQNNDIAFQMGSIDDGVATSNPGIISATLPKTVMVNSSDHRLFFQIEHSSEVAYTVEVTGGRIAKNMGDTPTSQITGVHSPTNALEIYYYAPVTPLVATISLTVKDLSGSDIIGSSFTINVVTTDPNTWTDSGITVVFGPAITGLAFSRSETTLKVEVFADSSSSLTYSWFGTGSFAGLAKTGNPIFIDNFSDSLSGTIEVAVTDANHIEASISRTIEAGDLPYTINNYIADMPGIYIYDDVTAMLWMDNTNKIRRSWTDAQTYCANLTLIDHSVWRLPTANELVSMFDRRADFSNIYETKYWSADDDINDTSKAVVVEFKNGTSSTESKTKQNIVRCVKN